ncbi:MAG: translation initiation factor IF-5A [Candidatus Lokiarchaeota archaeon]|nr:translation initiation factor IF-5A [Candidatus Lokiarchaeota archaeon]
MSLRRTTANKLKKGNYFMVDGEPCSVISTEHSKSGKHGHAKMRISCEGLFDKKKRSVMFTADAMIDIPEIVKSTGQITDVSDNSVTLMDLETFETLHCDWPTDEEDAINKLETLKNNPEQIGDSQAEFWDVVGKKIIRRVMIQ